MKFQKITKKNTIIKEPLFIKSIKLAKSNPNKTGLIILFDIMFLVSFFSSVFVLQNLTKYWAVRIAAPQTYTAFYIFLILTLIYYLILFLMLLFMYSLFKYFTLDYTRSLFEKTEFSLKRLRQFYSLNMILAGIFFLILLLFNFVLASIKQTYAPFVFIFLAIPYLLFLYVIVNTAHSSFYEGSSIKGSIKKSFNIAFAKIKSYREIILVIILFALLSWLLFSGSNYLFQKYAYRFSLINSKYIGQAYIIIFDIAFYLIILINRVSFYAIIRENK